MEGVGVAESDSCFVRTVESLGVELTSRVPWNSNMDDNADTAGDLLPGDRPFPYFIFGA